MSAGEDPPVVTVRIPDDYVSERSFIVRELLEGWLGLSVEIHPDDRPDVRLELSSGGRVIIRDRFFREHRAAGSYLTPGAIPEKVSKFVCPHAPDGHLISIFGDDEYEEAGGTITCGADLFSAAFFMLTRWEEHVLAEKDLHERTPSTSQLSVRAEFFHRPVVNEYVEALWGMLCAAGIRGPRAAREASLILTHDVDRIYHQAVVPSTWGALRRGEWKRALVTGAYGVLRIDPMATFRMMMTGAEERGLRAHFYFIPGGVTSKEGYYDLDQPFIRRLLEEIVARGHEVGLHPSYETYADAEQWRDEKRRLDGLLPRSCTQGRQHYLRFSNPGTWRLWASSGMKVDSTMGFADRVGFRSGTGDVHRVYDVLEREVLDLRERPLVIMDSALRRRHTSESTALVRRLSEISERYRMPLTVLFHNHLLDPVPWNRMRPVYDELLSASTARH